jgi:hypothetical protein
LQIKDLIERYKYNNSEDIANQMAHYSLLELIVDRLLLLIFLSSTFAENSLSLENSDINTNKINRLNAGLTIKKYWNKFSQLNTALRQFNCQVSQKIHFFIGSKN